MSSASCSWWWLCYMLKHIIWTSACISKLMSSASCSWWWLCYILKRIIWTSACVAKPMSNASCSWWWLCYMLKHIKWTSACLAKSMSSAFCSWSIDRKFKKHKVYLFAIFIYSFIYLFTLHLELTNLQLKTGIILYTFTNR